MTRYVAVHSFRRGVAKSVVAANLAVVLARSGLRLVLVGTGRFGDDLGLRLGVRLAGARFGDVVAGRAAISTAAHDVSAAAGVAEGRRLWVVRGGGPESDPLHDEEHDPERVRATFRELVGHVQPEVVVLDTEAGLTEDTIEIHALVDDLVLLVRPDRQDHQGTAVTLDVADRLSVPRTWLVLSHVVSGQIRARDRADAEAAFGTPVSAVLPFADGLTADDLTAPFVVRRSGHPWSIALRELASDLVSTWADPEAVHPGR